MAALFPPPPTYALPVLVSPDGSSVFNPIWLNWFLDVAAFISASGGGGGGGGAHNSLGGLQGGAANEYYHLSQANYTNLTGGTTNFTNLVLGGTLKFGTYTAAAIAQTGSVSITDSGGTVRRLLVG